ncbi:hypothetical protein Ddc_03562 [Ditylenchus destructor]|nr:hypothetical protein Ddc_03562 [Ditylenchus destructor]
MAVRILKNSDKVDGIEEKFSELQLGEIEASKRKIRKLLHALNLLMEDRPEVAISSEKTCSTREMLSKEFEKLLALGDSRTKTLDQFWNFCWYAPIKECQTKRRIKERNRDWLKSFIDSGVEHLSKLLGKYDDLQRNLYIYIGDLHRYSVIMCRSDHLQASRNCYEKALSEGNPNEYNGRSLNQIALLYQYQKGSEMLWQSVRLLLRAMIAPVPYERAWDNLKTVDGIGFEGHRKIAFDLIKSSLDEFSRIEFDKLSADYEEILEKMLQEEPSKTENVLDTVSSVSLMTAHVLKSETCDDVQLRTVGSFALRLLHTLLTHLRKQQPPESDENNENGDYKDVMIDALTITAEFLSMSSEKFTTKKIPVSLKIYFKNLLQTFAEMLNNIEQMHELLATEEDNYNCAITEWLVNGTVKKTMGNKLYPLVLFSKQCINNKFIPITFNERKFIAMNNINNGDPTGMDPALGFVEKVTKVQQEYAKNQV